MPTPKLSEAQLLQVLPIISENLHNTYITIHAEQRMIKRHISYDDVIHTLQSPKKLLDVRYDEVTKLYKYKICGINENIHIVIAIDGIKRKIHIVTVINKLYNY